MDGEGSSSNSSQDGNMGVVGQMDPDQLPNRNGAQ